MESGKICDGGGISSRCFLLFSKDAAVKKKRKGTTTNAGGRGETQGNGPHPPPPDTQRPNGVSDRAAGTPRCNLPCSVLEVGCIASWMCLVLAALARQRVPDARLRPHLAHCRRYAPRTPRGPDFSRARRLRFSFFTHMTCIKDIQTMISLIGLNARRRNDHGNISIRY